MALMLSSYRSEAATPERWWRLRFDRQTLRLELQGTQTEPETHSDCSRNEIAQASSSPMLSSSSSSPPGRWPGTCPWRSGAKATRIGSRPYRSEEAWRRFTVLGEASHHHHPNRRRGPHHVRSGTPISLHTAYCILHSATSCSSATWKARNCRHVRAYSELTRVPQGIALSTLTSRLAAAARHCTQASSLRFVYDYLVQSLSSLLLVPCDRIVALRRRKPSCPPSTMKCVRKRL